MNHVGVVLGLMLVGVITSLALSNGPIQDRTVAPRHRFAAQNASFAEGQDCVEPWSERGDYLTPACRSLHRSRPTVRKRPLYLVHKKTSLRESGMESKSFSTSALLLYLALLAWPERFRCFCVYVQFQTGSLVVGASRYSPLRTFTHSVSVNLVPMSVCMCVDVCLYVPS